MQIQDIMTKKVIVATPQMPINEVAHLLTENRIHGAPVVDGERRVIGIITEIDFFTKDATDIYLPLYISMAEKLKLPEAFSPKQKEVVEGLLAATASDIMTAPAICIHPEADAQELITLVKEKNLATVPVTDGEGKLVGIVAVADLIRIL